MGVSAASFQGRQFYRPGAYGAFQAAAQPLGPSDDLVTQIIIGQADNGANCNSGSLKDEERYYVFTDYQTAKSVLRGGNLLEAIKHAFAPSTEAGYTLGPQFIKAFNVNPNTAATKTLDTTKASNLSTVTAVIAGIAGNLIRMRKTLATKKIEIGTADGVQTSPALDFPVMTLQYTGNGTAAALTVDSTGLHVAVTPHGSTPDGSASLDILFADYTYLGDVIDKINSTLGYVATAVASYDFLFAKLDAIISGDAISVLTLKTLQADAYAEEIFLNSTGIVTYTMATVRRPLADMTEFVYLASGTTGTPGGTAYTDAITFSEKVSGLYRNIMSTVQADQIAFRDSIIRLNSAEGSNEALGGCGANTSDSLAVRKANAQTLASEFIVYGVSKFNNYDIGGTSKLYGGAMLAVLHNAIKASGSPHRTPTWKALNILSQAEVLTNTERAGVIQAGGLVIAQVKKAGATPLVIERAVTTYQYSNIVYNESNSVAIGLTMVKELREMFNANLIGEVPVDASARVQGPTEADIKSLFELKMDEFVSRGFLRGSALLGTVAWERTSYKIVINGDSFYFTNVHGKVSVPLNFVFYLLTLDVNRGVATAS